MATKITRDIDESRLHCKLKAHLKLDPGIQSGLRFLCLIVGGVGLLVTALLARSVAARSA
jgi:hypothetical protein